MYFRNHGDRNHGDRNHGDRNHGDRNHGDRNHGESDGNHRYMGERVMEGPWVNGSETGENAG